MPKEELFKVGDKVGVVVAGTHKHYEVVTQREDGQYGLAPVDAQGNREPPSGEDGEGEPASNVVFYHPNAILAPGQRFQYRQRRVDPDEGGIAAEANRLARDGFRLVNVQPTRNNDGDDRALLIFEREV